MLARVFWQYLQTKDFIFEITQFRSVIKIQYVSKNAHNGSNMTLIRTQAIPQLQCRIRACEITTFHLHLFCFSSSLHYLCIKWKMALPVLKAKD